jgi:hypothetical protein
MVVPTVRVFSDSSYLDPIRMNEIKTSVAAICCLLIDILILSFYLCIYLLHLISFTGKNINIVGQFLRYLRIAPIGLLSDLLKLAYYKNIHMNQIF